MCIRDSNYGGEIEIIAGNYKDIPGAASTFTPLHLYNAKLNTGAKADFSFPGHFNTAALVIEGSIRVNAVSYTHLDVYKRQV